MITETMECSECHKNKKPYLKGLCKTCYERRGRRMRNNLNTCTQCGKRKVLNNKQICRNCAQGTVKLVICSFCGQLMPHFAKHMCRRCYYRQWGGCRQKIVCPSCGRMRVVHSHNLNGGTLCAACHRATRVGVCFKCDQTAQMAKKQLDGTMLCWRCYADIRPTTLCGTCGNIAILAVTSPPLCYKCYICEYNQKPTTVARKAVYLAKRRAIEAEGNFTSQDWLDLMRLWNWKCAYCEVKLTHGTRSTDHIIPLTKGGANKKDNIIPCCRSCNSKKNNRLLSEWLEPEVYAQILLRIMRTVGGQDNV